MANEPTPAGRAAFDKHDFYNETLKLLKDENEEVRLATNIVLQRLVISPIVPENTILTDIEQWSSKFQLTKRLELEGAFLEPLELESVFVEPHSIYILRRMYPKIIFKCHGSLVVMAGMLQVQAKYPPCRGTMHIKSVKFKRPPIGVVVRRGEFQLRCRP
ncbi:hypothetical protein TNCV_2142441 [Trichonephila clavipes]|nr:hypothetical protein TNCV_2142441 [Trichonephila clavipes]